MKKSFLQSNEWADFQKRLGRNVWQIDGINVIEHKLPMNKSYFYSPRLCPSDCLLRRSGCEGRVGGQAMPTGRQARLQSFVDRIKKIAEQENAIFFKLEPEEDIDKDLLKEFGFIKSKNIQPLKTIILDITKSEQEILNQMHSKMRYNIGLAQKKGIILRTGNNQHDFEEFWRLTLKTGKRDGFRHYAKEYYKEILEIPGVKLFLAELNGKIIVANIVVFYKQRAIYLHGASDYKYRNLMAAPLLQWHQILEAKKAGCIEYDFWGIDEIKWPGVTRFKKCFGGKEITYPGAFDLIFQPIWYRIYKIAKKFL
ncbi:peptidoglycan bridge formation glycyltransferase FemA/FemB family protein [Patescibacteria group bacterium]|nr:peptidoglycan bridge formation glycyltransferase FemA/FemB family protein [Patescibacteria group bacterium]MBU4458791.1 peptidoglycan bridge formation glycyltransferase FemA/FemB family protein [Patescibacteria group bacterium]MCG2696405.1 peptidoglycan bridge formation glycyltransferase FemA/FemB family protein [Candidatus Portnoybacteria bacterium]